MKKNSLSLEQFLNVNYKMVIEPYENLDYGENGLVITCPDLPGIKVFGETLEEALEELHEAKIAWYEMKEELEEEVLPPVTQKKLSGRLTLRLSTNLHEKVVQYSETYNLSVNNAINSLITEGLRTKNDEAILQEIKELKKHVMSKPAPIMIKFQNEGLSSYKLEQQEISSMVGHSVNRLVEFDANKTFSSGSRRFHFEDLDLSLDLVNN